MWILRFGFPGSFRKGLRFRPRESGAATACPNHGNCHSRCTGSQGNSRARAARIASARPASLSAGVMYWIALCRRTVLYVKGGAKSWRGAGGAIPLSADLASVLPLAVLHFTATSNRKRSSIRLQPCQLRTPRLVRNVLFVSTKEADGVFRGDSLVSCVITVAGKRNDG